MTDVRWPIVVASLLVSACGAPNPSPRGLPEGLIVLPAALHVRVTNQNSGGVIYELAEPYPADAVIKKLNERLTQKGWVPLRYDVLNPGLETSFDRPWSNFQDGTKPGPPKEVFQWQGQWRAPDGYVAIYNLRYDGVTTPDGHVESRGILHIGAARLSATEIGEIRSLADRSKGSS